MTPTADAIDAWVNRWIGAPFAHDGRTTAGVDCYGLVVRFYADLFGIILPDWRGNGARGWIITTIAAERAKRWRTLAEAADPCLALVHRRAIDRPHHMGIHWRAHIVHAVESGVKADPAEAFARHFGAPEYGHLRGDR